jgi:hypothetical protein
MTQKVTGGRTSEQYTKGINTSQASASVITIYPSSTGLPPTETCEMGGLEDLEREGRVNCGLCWDCCGPEPEGPSLGEQSDRRAE